MSEIDRGSVGRRMSNKSTKKKRERQNLLSNDDDIHTNDASKVSTNDHNEDDNRGDQQTARNLSEPVPLRTSVSSSGSSVPPVRSTSAHRASTAPSAA